MLVVMPVLVEELLAAEQEDRTRLKEIISYRCKISTRSRLLGCVSSKTFLNVRGKEENGRKALCKYRLRFTIEAERSVSLVKVKLTLHTQIKCHKAHLHNTSFSINLGALFISYLKIPRTAAVNSLSSSEELV